MGQGAQAGKKQRNRNNKNDVIDEFAGRGRGKGMRRGIGNNLNQDAEKTFRGRRASGKGKGCIQIAGKGLGRQISPQA